MLSQKAVDDFKALVKKKRGIELSDSVARSMAQGWLEFFAFVCKPIPNEEQKRK
jgi:hypothetical protein